MKEKEMKKTWTIYHLKTNKYWKKQELGGGLTKLKSRAQLYTKKQACEYIVQFKDHVIAYEL